MALTKDQVKLLEPGDVLIMHAHQDGTCIKRGIDSIHIDCYGETVFEDIDGGCIKNSKFSFFVITGCLPCITCERLENQSSSSIDQQTMDEVKEKLGKIKFICGG